MDLSDSSFKGNKNKTGQTLGTSIPIVCYADSTSDSIAEIPHTNVDASLTLRGNKNGSGSKLGSMHHNNENIHEHSMADHSNTNVKQIIPFPLMVAQS